MEGEAAIEMPRYVCHKKVWALKIAKVTVVGDDGTTEENSIVDIEFEDERFAVKRVGLRGKPTPEAGWYYVVYKDNYFSFSPAKEFEDGYTLESELEPKTTIVP